MTDFDVTFSGPNGSNFDAVFQESGQSDVDFGETHTINNGENGLSAYEVAVKNGFAGSEKEWLESLKGEPGKDGEDGDDGHTPVKGVDYFTEADKTEMVAAVIAALPVYNGEVVAV